MKVALLADIHDNHPRLEEAIKVSRENKVEVALCLGDVSNHETLEVLSQGYKKVYLVFGNMDFKIKQETGLFPENIFWYSEEGGELELRKQKIFIVHYDFLAQRAASTGKYDLVFYGHTHTPWVKEIGKTILLNPGEVAGQYGPATFAIFDLLSKKAELKRLS